MKTNGILPIFGKVVFAIFSLFVLNPAFSQPDYSFKNPVLVSGTDLAVGSVYLFTNVKTGVDARVEVKSFNGGISLSSIDETWTGFDEAFQPFINVSAHSDGYVEFEIRFYIAGTTTLMNQAEVPMTPIDVDGADYTGGYIYEYDQIQLKSAYFNYSTSTSELTINHTAGWLKGKNSTGSGYPGVDTSAKGVMFTVVNSGISSVLLRIGAQNTSDDFDVRYRSVYFKKFNYPNGVLASNQLINFSGIAVNNKINLNFSLSDPAKIKAVMIEKAGSNMAFNVIQEIKAKEDETQYQYLDPQSLGISYYRLRIIQNSGSYTYSNILRFENKNESKEQFKVYPSVINDNAIFFIQSSFDEITTLQIFDYNGRIVYSKQFNVKKGTNNYLLNGIDNLSRGGYIASVRKGKDVFQQKLVKQ